MVLQRQAVAVPVPPPCPHGWRQSSQAGRVVGQKVSWAGSPGAEVGQGEGAPAGEAGPEEREPLEGGRHEPAPSEVCAGGQRPHTPPLPFHASVAETGQESAFEGITGEEDTRAWGSLLLRPDSAVHPRRDGLKAGEARAVPSAAQEWCAPPSRTGGGA